ncbi:hypothetical protein AVEN_152291-1 [Araneus ventricosus]|uniref:Ig-like domain-containing protein n=1 Tax=Araneus ventricosus TaxID=182803 RepID=A0A4Y2K7M0_ARAVE|nr:hypothetical protein AVEN_152291-1 [Araneus ventricosus]
MRTMVVCTVLAGESPINILWLKDSMPLLHSEHRDGIHVTNLGEFASSLTIPSVSRYHAGNYTCLVASGAAQASYTAVMNVKELQSAAIHQSFKKIRRSQAFIELKFLSFKAPIT